MQLHFTGRNLEVTSALKTYTTEKFQKLERRHNHITNIKVIFQVEHLTHIAEATFFLDGVELHASAQAENMYNAVDTLIDKLATQITKHKEKNTDHHR